MHVYVFSPLDRSGRKNNFEIRPTYVCTYLEKERHLLVQEKEKREVEKKALVIEFVLNLVQVRSRRKIQKLSTLFLSLRIRLLNDVHDEIK